MSDNSAQMKHDTTAHGFYPLRQAPFISVSPEFPRLHNRHPEGIRPEASNRLTFSPPRSVITQPPVIHGSPPGLGRFPPDGADCAIPWTSLAVSSLDPTALYAGRRTAILAPRIGLPFALTPSIPARTAADQIAEEAWFDKSGFAVSDAKKLWAYMEMLDSSKQVRSTEMHTNPRRYSTRFSPYVLSKCEDV